MGVLLSEGEYSEAGFLTTTDGGVSWKFYDPPSTGISNFFSMNNKYWAVGQEVVDKDKPGGGHSVPLAIFSDDGVTWDHLSHEMKACHWQGCGLCTASGCLASNTLLIDFFGPQTIHSAIPIGNLTAKWALYKNRICSIHDGITCATLKTPTDIQSAGNPKPFEQSLPPLSAKGSSGEGLHCIACALEPIYVDNTIEGHFTVHIALLILPDGSVESAELKDAPSASLATKVHAQMVEWLFEPPTQEGKPVRMSIKTVISLNVVRSR